MRNRSVWLLSLGFAMIFFGAHSVERHLIPMFGGDADFAIRLLIIAFLSLVAGDFVAPAIITRLRARNTLVVAGLGFSAWIGAMGILAPEHKALAVLISIPFGLGVGLMWNASILYISYSVEEAKLGGAFGLNHSLYAIGTAAGLVACSRFIAEFSFREIFLVMAGVAFIGALCFLGMKDIPTDQKIKLKEVIPVLMNRNLLRLCAIPALLFFLYALLVSQVIVDVEKVAGKKAIGDAQAVIYGCLFGSIIIGHLVDWLGKRVALATAFATAIGGLAVLYTADSMTMIVVGIGLISVSHAILWVVMGMLGTLAPASKMIFAIAIVNAADDVSVVVSLVLIDLVKSKALYLIGVGLTILTILVLWRLLKHKDFTVAAREGLKSLE